MTRPRKNPGVSGIRTRDLPLSRRTPYHLANEADEREEEKNDDDDDDDDDDDIERRRKMMMMMI